MKPQLSACLTRGKPKAQLSSMHTRLNMQSQLAARDLITCMTRTTPTIPMTCKISVTHNAHRCCGPLHICYILRITFLDQSNKTRGACWMRDETSRKYSQLSSDRNRKYSLQIIQTLLLIASAPFTVLQRIEEANPLYDQHLNTNIRHPEKREKIACIFSYCVTSLEGYLFPHSVLNLVNFLNLHHDILSLPGETVALGIRIVKSIL